MSTAIEKRPENAVSPWTDAEKVRKLFAPTLTADEFEFFIGLGNGLQANPFKREIWAVKYDAKAPASIFLSRDFYRRKAQEQADYNGHMAEAVYENDGFAMDARSGIPEHKYGLKNRGKLVGAYALAWRKGIDRPFYIYVSAQEYTKGQSTWRQMPETMLKKVAEAQVLRMAWQGLYAGTYGEGEQAVIEASYVESAPELPTAPVAANDDDLEQHIAALYASMEADLEKPENVDKWICEQFPKCQTGFADIKTRVQYEAVKARWEAGNVEG